MMSSTFSFFPPELTSRNLHKALRTADNTLTQQLCEKWKSTFPNLKSKFKDLDASGLGRIPYFEFARVIREADPKVSSPTLYDFITALDEDMNGCVDYKDFHHKFKKEFAAVKQKSTARSLMRQVGAVMVHLAQSPLRRQLRSILQDTAIERGIQFEAFNVVIDFLSAKEQELVESGEHGPSQTTSDFVPMAKWSEQDKKAVFEILDVDQNGSVSLSELERGLMASLFETTDTTNILATITKYGQDLKELITSTEFENAKMNADEFVSIFGTFCAAKQLTFPYWRQLFNTLCDSSGWLKTRKMLRYLGLSRSSSF